MSDEKKEKDPRHPARSTDPERGERGHTETNFLPPLSMFLAFFDKKKKKDTKQEKPDEKSVEKLIEKLSESEEGQVLNSPKDKK